ncbi:DNA polymerase III subunit gamma and tau [Nesterenkonia flava]|uniref:DNA-directed DNA polymerase n=2 Tax=Nesterenkonia flava TaxID=469799 RepID=A0ABU1FVP8_9MICC|nr:DNA polymerase III subunit gamma and tau [Nesterenkonia flava]MDR5712327.1 DNA polymerase III subunit gamma and tau [Nesterenkonia flava]
MTTALYRRYRPDTFADVIGQEHVTGPLVTALGKDAVSHAYLFSGPRGCGKTTSARILARCLNCAQGPTGSPCGECESCRELATGGPGSLDVIEIDAASHGGVDDARDLRERATFAPVRDRYKIFIIDEAHMVTAAGFNALLKIVEEPPEHIKFIFATTEPDKVIGTIRSRTHHYPFRLVPPEPLLDYLERLCAAENVAVAPGVLQLVLRAGGGSVRDTLSVLDQLIAGSEEGGIAYDRAVALLGFTHAALLDQVVDAVADLNGAQAFSVVDQVVQSGQDPRRFVEDLLERLRDLIVVKSVPENPAAILRGVPEDQIRAMTAQAAKLGSAELSRAADTTATALTEMVGATSPRLHLELLMARLLLPHAEQGHASLAARLERLERRLDFTTGAGVTPAAEAPSEAAAPSPPEQPTPHDDDGWATPGVSWGPPTTPDPVGPSTPEPVRATSGQPESGPAASEPSPSDSGETEQGWGQEPASSSPAPGRPRHDQSRESHGQPTQGRETHARQHQGAGPHERPSAPQWDASPQQAPGAPAAAPPSAPAQQTAPQQQPSQAQRSAASSPSGQQGGRGGSEMMQRAWPDIVEAMKSRSRMLWMLVKGNVSVTGFDGATLTLAFANEGARNTFSNRKGEDALNEAIQEVLGMQVRYDLVTGGAPPTGGGAPPKAEGRSTPAAAEEPPADWDTPTEPPASSEDDWSAPSASSPQPTAPSPVSASSPTPATHQDNPERGWTDAGAQQGAGSPSSASDSVPSPAPQSSTTQGPAPQETESTSARPAHHAPPEKPVIPAFARRAGGSAPAASSGASVQQTTPAAPASEAGSRAAEIRQRLAARRPTLQEPPPDPFGDVPPDPMYDNTPPPDWAEAAAPSSDMDDIPSDDDVTLEHSGVFGRRAIERILGGVLIEERSLREDEA